VAGRLLRNVPCLWRPLFSAAWGWFGFVGWAFGGVAGVVSFFCTHSFSNHLLCPVWILPFLTSLALSRGALQQVQVRGPCAKSAACGLRIRIVAWTDRLEVQEPNGSASLCGVGETFTLLW
jgi:hypothetical protein